MLARRHATMVMTHFAIQEALDHQTVDWMEKVGDKSMGRGEQDKVNFSWPFLNSFSFLALAPKQQLVHRQDLLQHFPYSAVSLFLRCAIDGEAPLRATLLAECSAHMLRGSKEYRREGNAQT